MPLSIPDELIAAAQRGDAASVESVLELAWPHAFRIANVVLRDPHAAQDAAQEACAIVYRSIGALKSTSAFSAWFWRIVTREAMAIGKMQKHEPIESLSSVPVQLETRNLDVASALLNLPVHLRIVLVLRYYADLNSKEIARALGIAAPTVRFRLSQARSRVERLLTDYSDYKNAHEVTP